MSLENLFGELALEATLGNRFGGGYSSAIATVNAVGSTTVVDPAPNNRLVVAWVSAIADPGADDNPLITISLGGTPIYHGYAIAHWEIFEGPINGNLTVSSDVAIPIAVTVHYKEIA